MPVHAFPNTHVLPGWANTDRDAFPVTPVRVALIVVAPAAIPLAKPVELIVAFAVTLDAHVTVFVQFAVLLSE